MNPERQETGPRFYGRRCGKPLRTQAQDLVDRLLPDLLIPPPTPGEGIDPASLFSAPKRAYWLEIGFGGGEHLAWQANRNPDVGLIGAEVFLNGVARFLGHAERDGFSNVRIWNEDVRRILALFPEACFERVFVLFPDPWPKKRHRERRFIGQPNLDLIARLLTKDGLLRIGTDDAVHKAWVLEQMSFRSDFQSVRENIGEKPADWPDTRYEMKALREGRAPIYLEYRRFP